MDILFLKRRRPTLNFLLQNVVVYESGRSETCSGIQDHPWLLIAVYRGSKYELESDVKYTDVITFHYEVFTYVKVERDWKSNLKN